MNSRRHPRTMLDAFKGVDYGCSIERPYHQPLPRALWLAMFAGLLVSLFSALDLL